MCAGQCNCSSWLRRESDANHDVYQCTAASKAHVTMPQMQGQMPDLHLKSASSHRLFIA